MEAGSGSESFLESPAIWKTMDRSQRFTHSVFPSFFCLHCPVFYSLRKTSSRWSFCDRELPSDLQQVHPIAHPVGIHSSPLPPGHGTLRKFRNCLSEGKKSQGIETRKLQVAAKHNIPIILVNITKYSGKRRRVSSSTFLEMRIVGF